VILPLSQGRSSENTSVMGSLSLKSFPIYHSPVVLPLDDTTKKLRQCQWYFELKEKKLEKSSKGNLTLTEKSTYDLLNKKNHRVTLCTVRIN